MCEDRIHSLEQKLRESERERHRYQNEANRIKEMMQRNVMSTRHAAQIGTDCFSLNLLVPTKVPKLTPSSLFQQNQSEPVKVVT